MARDPNRRREENAPAVTNLFVVCLVYQVSLTAEPSISSSEATGSNKSIVICLTPNSRYLPMHLRGELAGLGLLFLVVVYHQISRWNQPIIRARCHRFEGDLSARWSTPFVVSFSVWGFQPRCISSGVATASTTPSATVPWNCMTTRTDLATGIAFHLFM